MRMRLLAILAALALPGAAAAQAEWRALVVGNGAYRLAAPVPGAPATAGAAAEALRGAGFVVVTGSDLDAAGLRGALSRLAAAEAGEPAGRIVVVLAGHFARSRGETWFLGVDAQAPDLGSVAAAGIPLGAVLDLAAAVPGGALVALATEDRVLPLGPLLAPGIGALDVPQGVTVLRGRPSDLAALMRDGLLAPGSVPAALLSAHPEIAAEGFVSAAAPFLPAPSNALPDAEAVAWAAARRIGTAAAYQTYLEAWPQGANAAAARAALAQPNPQPTAEERAAAAETALALSRDSRRAVQRALTLLGYGTRGIDGIFGPGTRGAIAGWQAAQGLDRTGYLTAEQVTRIEAQAARRAAELEAEAAARRAAEEQADRAFWSETGARGDEAGLRAYLRRHPDGLFADAARARLAAIEAAQREQAAERDRADWARAERQDTVAAYRGYLAEFPQGAFARAATDRIEALSTAPDEGDRAEARRAEAALGLNDFSRNVLESRLQAAGFDPGRVDGVFDESTRRAIRRFQRSRDLPVTGFLNERVVVLLLAGTIRTQP
jgi:peptidoglycan hydrolase-like protein with peptidoglycan-binding domain